MDASPILRDALRALHRHRLEAVMIGNAAAALHGAPVTTLDIDFMFREAPVNLRKLKAVAKDLEAVIMRPYYPVSKLYRMTNDDRGMQLDFMPVIHGVRSFASLKSRAVEITVHGEPVWLASLEDIIRSKRTACRLRDTAVLPVLEKTLHEQRESR
jgi:predicted nucleotidyltransferase